MLCLVLALCPEKHPMGYGGKGRPFLSSLLSMFVRQTVTLLQQFKLPTNAGCTAEVKRNQSTHSKWTKNDNCSLYKRGNDDRKEFFLKFISNPQLLKTDRVFLSFRFHDEKEQVS